MIKGVKIHKFRSGQRVYIYGGCISCNLFQLLVSVKLKKAYKKYNIS